MSNKAHVVADEQEISKSFPDVNDVPEDSRIAVQLKVSYDNDINILEIHRYVRMNFAIMRKNSKNIKSKAKEFMNKSLSEHLTINQKRDLEKKANKLINKSKRYDSDDDWKRYIDNVYDLLCQYKEYMSQQTRGILYIGKQVTNKECPKVQQKRSRIIIDYFNHLSDHLDVYISKRKSFLLKCSICSRPYDENNVDAESDQYICECGDTYYVMSKEITYHDPHSISPKNFIAEDTSSGFLDTINKFMGKQMNNNIPKLLYEQFDDYLRNQNHPIGADYIAMPIQSREHIERIGNTHGTSVGMLINMLKETNNSLYYEDINLIGHVYFGWLLPNLNKWLDDILLFYKMTKSVYDRIPGKRNSVLNGKIILYFILDFLKIPCSSEDFKLMDTKDSFDNYLENWKLMSGDPEVQAAREKFFKDNGIVPVDTDEILISV